MDSYNFKKNIIDVLKRASMISAEHYPSEKIILNNGDFLLPNSYETFPSDRLVFEAHRKYIDVMYMIEGSEIIKVKNTNDLTNITTEYDDNGDYLLAEENEDISYIQLNEGDFIILYPQDAHCPACSISNTPQNVKKIIGKLRIN